MPSELSTATALNALPVRVVGCDVSEKLVTMGPLSRREEPFAVKSGGGGVYAPLSVASGSMWSIEDITLDNRLRPPRN